MNIVAVVGVIALLIALLALLSRWQRSVETARGEKVLSEIREAKDRGSDKAIAQHPLIDVQACIGCGTCIKACPEDEVIGLVDGVAHIIHGSRCIGFGLCAEACPVAAIEIGLGDVSNRTDIPRLSENFETSVPGIYIAGELGGFALIRVAVEQGTEAVEAVHRDLASSGREGGAEVRDLLIVGAGPAGLAASLAAIEKRLSYVTIDQDDIGGTVRKYPRRKLTLTGSFSMPLHGKVDREEFLKEELIEFWEGIIARHGVEIRSGVKFLGAEPDGDGVFDCETSEGTIRARRVLLALGRRGTPRKLDVPGENSEKVFYQLVDAATFTNQRVLIVGGGDSAIEAATALASQPGNAVTLSYRRHAFFRLKRRNEERIEQFEKKERVHVLFNSKVSAIEGDLVRLTYMEDGIERALALENDFVFVLAGGEPPYPLLKEIGVDFGQAEAAKDAEAAQNQGVTVEV